MPGHAPRVAALLAAAACSFAIFPARAASTNQLRVVMKGLAVSPVSQQAPAATIDVSLATGLLPNAVVG